MIADTATPVGSLSADVGVTEHKFHQSAFWHIITETIFYYPKLHLTEKIFRPIVNKRPFMLVGAPGNLAYLKSYGFKTFNRWIDESYDQELDNDRRIELITEQVEKISRLSLNELRAMQKEMSDILEFNFNHFYGDFRKIITHELLNNFKTCIQQWNHGKFDRTIDIESLELDKVEKLLLS